MKTMPIEQISNSSQRNPTIRANRMNKERKTAKPKGTQAHALNWHPKFNFHLPKNCKLTSFSYRLKIEI